MMTMMTMRTDDTVDGNIAVLHTKGTSGAGIFRKNGKCDKY